MASVSDASLPVSALNLGSEAHKYEEQPPNLHIYVLMAVVFTSLYREMFEMFFVLISLEFTWLPQEISWNILDYTELQSNLYLYLWVFEKKNRKKKNERKGQKVAIQFRFTTHVAQ